MTPDELPIPPPGSGRDLEEAFFHQEDRRLIERLRQLKQMEETRQALAEVSGIRDQHVLDKLVSLGGRPEALAAREVIPLIEVAWADGSGDARERAAVLASLEEAGVAKGGIEHELVESWLDRRPGPALVDAWEHFVQGLCRSLDQAERDALESELLKGLRQVAEASGGFAGFRKISAAETAMIEKLKKGFRAG